MADGGGLHSEARFGLAEELQRDPDPPPSRWPFWLAASIVAGVLVGVWAV
jgi:hypothetical protein